MALNFTDALMEAKRRGQLMGRPLTANETAGIAEGYADSASARLARAKSLGLQERQISNQENQFSQTFTENQRITNEQLRRADEATSEQKKQNLISNIGTGAVVANYLTGGKLASGAGSLITGLFEGGAASATPSIVAGAEALPVAGEAAASGAGLSAASFLPPVAMAAAIYGINQWNSAQPRAMNPVQAFRDVLLTGEYRPQEGRDAVHPSQATPEKIELAYKQHIATQLLKIPNPAEVGNEGANQYLDYHQLPPQYRAMIDAAVEKMKANPEAVQDWNWPGFTNEEWFTMKPQPIEGNWGD